MAVTENPNSKDATVDQNTIIQASPELVHRAVASLPIPIVGGEITFSAGIPMGVDDQGHQTYREECKRRGIIPNTILTLSLYSQTNVVQMETTSGTYEQALLFISGGKPSKIKTNIDQIGFQNLNSGIRPSLQDDGYVITDGQLAVTTYYQRDNEMSMGGDFLDTGVTISHRKEGSTIRLQIGGKSTNEQNKELRKWFDSLREIR